MGESIMRIAIFASGGGSNAHKILDYFSNHPTIRVVLVISNNKSAGVHDIAKQFNVPSIIVNRVAINQEDKMMLLFKEWGIDFIVLAGFMLLIPKFVIEAYQNKILNIHPALLPKYGGPGMYGHFVHEAVKLANEDHSGMTIHVVNDVYDDGKIIFQDSCKLNPDMNAQQIAEEVLKLEHKHYASQIEKYILGFGKNRN